MASTQEFIGGIAGPPKNSLVTSRSKEELKAAEVVGIASKRLALPGLWINFEKQDSRLREACPSGLAGWKKLMQEEKVAVRFCVYVSASSLMN